MNKHTPEYLWRMFMKWRADHVVQFDEDSGLFVRRGGPSDMIREIR